MSDYYLTIWFSKGYTEIESIMIQRREDDQWKAGSQLVELRRDPLSNPLRFKNFKIDEERLRFFIEHEM